MKRMAQFFTALLLCMALSSAWVMAEEKLTVDPNGLVEWDSIEGVEQYLCLVLDGENETVAEWIFPDPYCYLIPECRVEVYPLSNELERGELLFTTDYYVETYQDSEIDDELNDGTHELGITDPETGEHYVDPLYSIKFEDLMEYDVVANIDENSVRMANDGSIEFETAMPNGNRMRFTGEGVTYQDGNLVFAPNSSLTALDAIGRICAAYVEIVDAADADYFTFTSAYTFTDETSVQSADELFIEFNDGGLSVFDWRRPETTFLTKMASQPNFISCYADNVNAQNMTVSQLLVYYDETAFTTNVREAILWADMYGVYLEGDAYDSSKEVFNREEGPFDFYLVTVPDIADRIEPLVFESTEDPNYLVMSVNGLRAGITSVGALKDAQGNVLDKENAKVMPGTTIEVKVGKYTLDVELPVIERYAEAQTLHELTPYNNAYSEGSVTALVIPVYWQDQPENATDDVLQKMKAELGRVVDEQGVVTDYSAELADGFSLSAYYDTASYGQYAITSYVTDWFAAPFNYEGDREFYYQLSDTEFMEALYAWLMETYSDMDWTQFDADADGFFDSVIIVNAGTSDSGAMSMGTYSYAQQISPGYTGEGAGKPESPAIHNYVGLNVSFIEEEARTLIHEYAHGFGIVDYYDVTYSGIDAVGAYDMQSSNIGDWNAYSKYAVGWIEPQVVTELVQGESVEITIGALADVGDAIVIPAAGAEFDGPFGEYILIDLLTDSGVNADDAAYFGLDGVHGVRISHVNSHMEKRVLTGTDGVEYPIGTIHTPNTYNTDGKYLLEVIQAGGKNTFTTPDDSRKTLTKDDLFDAGDVFSVETYGEFFADGLMDDGSEFGYTVEVVSIDRDSDGAYTATIRIARK